MLNMFAIFKLSGELNCVHFDTNIYVREKLI